MFPKTDTDNISFFPQMSLEFESFLLDKLQDIFIQSLGSNTF